MEEMENKEESSLNFEQAMERLEQIVHQLESEEVPLEEAIDLFQEGMRLSRLLSRKLEQAERKIEMLIAEEGNLQKTDFQIPDDEQGDTA